jgi:hypothetical protein
VYFETGRVVNAGSLRIATGITTGVAGATASRSWKVIIIGVSGFLMRASFNYIIRFECALYTFEKLQQPRHFLLLWRVNQSPKTNYPKCHIVTENVSKVVKNHSLCFKCQIYTSNSKGVRFEIQVLYLSLQIKVTHIECGNPGR